MSLLTVNKKDLAQLATEITQLKITLPAVLNQSKMANIGRVKALEEEALQLRKEKGEVESQVLYWKSRCQSAFAECQREKEENLKLRCDLQELTNQMSQQSEYCTSLGSACCTILWRVSRNEDSVQAILMGSKVDEFLSLISSTLKSFCEAYKTDWPQEDSHETQFILALCGIITNVAASAYGRDFLVNNHHGCQILDTHINVLSSMPISKCAQLKNLILMCLFNISINQKGIKYLSAKQGLMGLLAWLLQGEINNDVRVNTLRLIQSLLYDDTNISILHSLEEVLPLTALQDLGRDGNKEIRELALELISDIRHFQKEP
ncbi:hypothetical protein CHS0354_028573 [Potamilus streckersoni]|nr:hypothetical protein CHS0354_028573 [Potamilus streckersoni]